MKYSFRLVVVMLLAISALSLVGCGKKDLATMVVGKWSGQMSLSPEQAKNPMAKAMEGMMKCTFDLKADKTFTGTLSIAPVEGTWAVADGKVNMTMTKVMGMDIATLKGMASKQGTSDTSGLDKPLVGTPSEDGKTMSLLMPGSNGKPDETVAMTKDEAAK